MSWALIDDVVTVNAGETFVPAATVTDAGTVTPGSLLDKLTTASIGATPFMVTLLAVVLAPPMADEGDRVTNVGVNGVSINAAETTAVAYAPEIVTDVVAETAGVPMGKLPVDDPSEMRTLAGIEIALLLLDSATTAPPAGALSFRKTYPVADAPPITDVGETESAPNRA